MATAMSQLNVRIPTELKEQGDAAFSNAGISSTEAIRMLWQFAADHIHEPQALTRLFERNAATETRTAEAKDIYDDERMLQGLQFAKDAYEKMGISPKVNENAPSYKQLRDEYYESLIESEAF